MFSLQIVFSYLNVHNEKDAYNKIHRLTVPDLGVVERVGVKDPEQRGHPLPPAL